MAPQIGGVDLDRSAHTTGQMTATEISSAIDLANVCTPTGCASITRQCNPVEQRESIGAVLRLVKEGAVTGEPWRLVLTAVLKRP